jgi:hypothetical protein
MLVVVGVVAAAAACGDRTRRPLNADGISPDQAGVGGSIGDGAGNHDGQGSGSAGSGAAGGGIGGASGTGACADIFSDDQLPTYEIQIAPVDWAALVSDFQNMLANVAAGVDYHPYHPLAEFRYGNEVVPNTMIRLKGWSSWWQSIPDPDPKMQFVIAFDLVDGQQRFHGLRKVELDMPRIDTSYLRQRLALVYLRALGLPSQCANNGRLFINGSYYGLYTNLEHQDKEFTQRVFPEAPKADLWAAGNQLQTNTSNAGLPHPHLEALWAATDPTSIAAIVDMDEALLEWASEAMLADPDGYWVGHYNYYLYDHPTRGWLWVPHDLDATIDWADPHIDPLYYWGADITSWSPPWQHYAAIIKDYDWRERYVAALRHARDVYVSVQLPDKLDQFAAQIRDAVAADPTRPFTLNDHLSEISYLRWAITTRIDSVGSWLDCRAAPDSAVDADGDKRPFCMDCNDHDPATYPGAPEICGDGRDQDCDGRDWTTCQ